MKLLLAMVFHLNLLQRLPHVERYVIHYKLQMLMRQNESTAKEKGKGKAKERGFLPSDSVGGNQRNLVLIQ